VLDAGYKTPYICKVLIDDEVIPVMPYKRPQTKKVSLKNMNMYMMNTSIATCVRQRKY
jgi:hypothetical protein